MDTTSQNLVIPRGKIFFAKFLAGTQTPGPLRELGNCPEFTLTRESETLSHYSSQAGMRTLDEEIVIDSSLTGSVVTDDIRAENVALWFMGDLGSISQSALSDQEETFEDVQGGDTFQLGRTPTNPTGVRSVADVVVTDGAPATPQTFTLGEDYTVDLALGLLTILPDGAAVGGNIEVTYDVGASSREQIIAGDKQIEGELRFISFNAMGPQADYTIPRARIAPNGDFSLVNDPESTAFQQMPMSITALKKGNLALAYRDGRAVTA